MQSRDLNNNISTQKISIIELAWEKKALIGLGLLTFAILIGAVFFLSRESETSVPDDQIITRSGLHWHPNLTITIDGKKQELPANIGITGAAHQKMHTHDTDARDGVVHIEAQGVVSKDDTKLGNFFRIWGKDFSSTTILDKQNTAEKVVRMTVNGKENKEFENYQMKDGDRIEITYQ
jgi:hypothetical protein